MKRLYQSCLRYQQGNSNKVYEVDCLELPGNGKNRYLINFRYGRYGKNLREGTKTPAPVDRHKADALFKSVVVSKLNKDYQLISGENPVEITIAPQPPITVVNTHSLDARRVGVIQRLEKQIAGWSEATEKSLTRTLWRMGELQIHQATPLLESLVSDKKKFWLRNYSIAWALGRCGDSKTLSIIDKISRHKNREVQRICHEVRYWLTPKQDRGLLLARYQASLLADITGSQQAKETESWITVIQSCLKQQPRQLFKNKPEPFHLETLYLMSMDNPAIRQAFLYWLEQAEFKGKSFQAIRILYKLAEFRLDSEVLGLITRRIAQTPANYYDWYADHQSYTQPTRDYLNRRSWRTLRRLAEIADPRYVEVASGLLLATEDAHGRQPGSNGYVSYGAFASFLAFNQILYRNSTQFRLAKSGRCWEQLSDHAPATRTEAFPHLWDEQPQALFHLLQQSQCQPVHEFASQALAENSQYCQQLPVAQWITLLSTEYAVTARFALKPIQAYYASHPPELAVIKQCLSASLAFVRQAGSDWLATAPEFIEQNLDWFAELITSEYADNRQLSRHYHSRLQGHAQKQQVLLGSIIAQLQQWHSADSSRVDDVYWVLLNPLKPLLKNIALAIIEDLLSHPLAGVQKIGAELLRAKKLPPKAIPESIYARLLQSASAEIRAIAVALLDNLDDTELAGNPEWLLGFLLSEDAETRHEARQIVRRIAQQNAAFAQTILEALVPALFRAEPHEGFHDDLVAWVSEDLPTALPNIDKNLLWRLLMAQSQAAQRAGANILQSRLASDYSVKQWAQLGRHSSVSVRQWAWRAYEQQPQLIQAQFEAALRLLDTDWEDARAFAIQYFRTRFEQDDWTTDRMIHLCDSTYGDVQRLGRDILTAFFRQDQGAEYLLKLSQHPASNVQLFASSFLHTYAGDSVPRIMQLKPYFTTVLSQVNKGRIAKDRVLQFLLQQAREHEAVGQLLAEIAEHHSITVAITDKAGFITAMRDIQAQYPAIALPLLKKTRPIRGYQPQEA